MIVKLKYFHANNNHMPQEHTPMKDPGGYLSEDQVLRLIDSCENLRDKALIATLAYTPRRVSEIVSSLRMSDIKWEDGMAVFTILKKNPRQRRDDGSLTPASDPPKKLKYVHPALLSIWRQYVDAFMITDDQFLFPFTRVTAFNIVRRIGEKAGITHVGSKRIHPHHFRHTFLTLASRHVKTVSGMQTLKREAEHSSEDMTAHYIGSAHDEAKAMYKRMFRNKV